MLLVRTGHMSRYLDRNDWRHYDLDPFPGVSVHTAPPRPVARAVGTPINPYALK